MRNADLIGPPFSDICDEQLALRGPSRGARATAEVFIGLHRSTLHGERDAPERGR